MIDPLHKYLTNITNVKQMAVFLFLLHAAHNAAQMVDVEYVCVCVVCFC